MSVEFIFPDVLISEYTDLDLMKFLINRNPWKTVKTLIPKPVKKILNLNRNI